MRKMTHERIHGYPTGEGSGVYDLEGGDARCVVTGSRSIRPGAAGSWISSKMFSYRCLTRDGREWVGRGYGAGMSLSARLAKTRVLRGRGLWGRR